MTHHKVAVLVGSLRKESFNRRIAQAIIALAPDTLLFSIVEIGDLPLFNQDNELEPPASVSAFKAQLEQVDAVLFATAEYNRSIPGVLKNALDVGSRPTGKSIWGGKPAAIVSASPGAMGGFGATHHLRQVLVALGMPTMAQPEVYLGNVNTLFDDKGAFAKPTTQEFLQKFATAFAQWIENNRKR